MTYTLVFRVTKGVMDALERGEKMTEYRDLTLFWDKRMMKVQQLRWSGEPVEALFLCGRQKIRYPICYVWKSTRDRVPERWRGYLTTPEVWAVELGERIA